MLKKWYMKTVNYYWFLRYGRWSDDQIAKFYDKYDTIFEFRAELIARKFVWASDGLNGSIELDTFARPGDVLARGFGNCGDYMRLFENFIKYKAARGVNVCGFYEQYELTSGSFKWHYAALLDVGGLTYIQTNLDVNQASDDAVLCEYFPEYHSARVVDRWMID